MAQETQEAATAASALPTGHIELVEGYFDENAQDWSDLYGKAQRVNDLVLADRKNSAVKHLVDRVPPGGRILDAGCGAGMTSVDLMGHGYSVHGVDISSKMLGHAEKNFERAGHAADRWELTCADVFGAGLKDEAYDGIAALGFLQYQEDERAALRELYRALKPGGTLVITGPTGRKFSNWLGMSRYYYGLRRRLKRVLKPAPAPAPAPAAAKPAAAPASFGTEEVLFKISPHRYGYGRFRELLGDTGFDLLLVRGHGYVNFEIIGRKIGQKGERFLHRSFTGMAKVAPFIGRWANDVIAVARKN